MVGFLRCSSVAVVLVLWRGGGVGGGRGGQMTKLRTCRVHFESIWGQSINNMVGKIIIVKTVGPKVKMN